MDSHPFYARYEPEGTVLSLYIDRYDCQRALFRVLLYLPHRLPCTLLRVDLPE